MAAHNELGKEGEKTAVEYLRKIGHEILVRNYRYRRAEIDIISKDGDLIIFTEVKTRSSEKFGYPEESVDRKKIKLLKLAAEEYTFQNKLESEVRFDIISLTTRSGKFEINHIKDAFFYQEDSSDSY